MTPSAGDTTRGGPPKNGSPTHVVTCFLLRQDRGKDELLLVRRSERVRTYRGHWAGISGYLESGVTPEEQAYTELREETGLTPAEVRLLAAGQPLPVHDVAAGLEWVVHPFLFHMVAPQRIQTDWEARASAWVAPEQVRTRPTVPGLVAALATVYPTTQSEPRNG